MIAVRLGAMQVLPVRKCSRSYDCIQGGTLARRVVRIKWTRPDQAKLMVRPLRAFPNGVGIRHHKRAIRGLWVRFGERAKIANEDSLELDPVGPAFRFAGVVQNEMRGRRG